VGETAAKRWNRHGHAGGLATSAVLTVFGMRSVEGHNLGEMNDREKPQLHFVGGLRRPAAVRSVTYSWPLVGLYIYSDRLAFGPGLQFMRKISRPLKVFTAGDIESVGATDHRVRFTFKNGERWIFGWCNVAGVLRVMAERGVHINTEVVPARWTPPL